MISNTEVEEYLPYPVKIQMRDVREHISRIFGDITEIRERHNKKHAEKIERVTIHFVSEDDEESELRANEFEIYIGKQLVYKGTAPDDCSDAELYDFYATILPVIENILEIWHDRIIEIQEENNIKIEELDSEENDEMLWTYYNMISDKRAFIYLKRLAARYHHGFFMSELKRTYRHGNWMHKSNFAMFRKLRSSNEGKNF